MGISLVNNKPSFEIHNTDLYPVWVSVQLMIRLSFEDQNRKLEMFSKKCALQQVSRKYNDVNYSRQWILNNYKLFNQF